MADLTIDLRLNTPIELMVISTKINRNLKNLTVQFGTIDDAFIPCMIALQPLRLSSLILIDIFNPEELLLQLNYSKLTLNCKRFNESEVLPYLTMRSFAYHTHHIHESAHGLMNHPTIEVLDLTSCQEGTCFAVAQIMKVNKKIKDLTISVHDQYEMEAISEHIDHIESLHILNFKVDPSVLIDKISSTIKHLTVTTLNDHHAIRLLRMPFESLRIPMTKSIHKHIDSSKVAKIYPLKHSRTNHTRILNALENNSTLRVFGDYENHILTRNAQRYQEGRECAVRDANLSKDLIELTLK